MDTSLIEQEIKKIEEEILKTQKNKATEHHIGKLKAKLARLHNEFEKRKSTGIKGKGFAIKKSGDATVGLVGFPSIGKSTLLNQLTDANSRVGVYEFTTIEVIPGMMKYNGANIQILDLPGLITGASVGKGRGREILSAVRNVDLILFIIDPKHKNHLNLMKEELNKAGLRLNQNKPDVVVKTKEFGGISINSTINLSYLNKDIIKSIASEYVTNAEIIIREDITEDQLIDVFIQNRKYVPAIVVINKQDLISKEYLKERINDFKKENWNVLSISASKRIGLNNLKKIIFSELHLIRIFMKPIGGKPDFNEPLILKRGKIVDDACKKLHRDFKTNFRYAQVWGKSAKYPGQKVGLEHVLEDGDILTLNIFR
jgi:small GTP-binding protein